MTELLAGLSIGLAAGLAPGPLQALVLTATLRNGFGAGWRVAAAPLLTDAPIIALTVLAVGSLPDGAVRSLGIAGGAVVVLFGVREMAYGFPGGDVGEATSSGDLWRGVIVNVLSPHPWLFWALAGAPLLIDAWGDAPERAVAFLAGFYGMLVGSKVALAAVVAAGRRRLAAQWRRRLVISGGGLLVVGGAVLISNWI